MVNINYLGRESNKNKYSIINFPLIAEMLFNRKLKHSLNKI